MSTTTKTNPDYKALYEKAMGQLAFISESAIEAQKNLEEMYLAQTDGI